MPPAEDIQRHLLGAWRMMTGKRDAVRMLDLSVDGFWNSFFAILIALPVLLVGWVPLANELAVPEARFVGRVLLVLRLAVVDIGSWVLPIAALAAISGYFGIRDRFVAYVVATNWGSALFAWFLLPASLLRLVAPGLGEAATALSLGIFLASMVLLWRLTDAAIDKGPGVATGVFAGMFMASVLTLFALQDLLGIGTPMPS
jgi:hypothetical protein